MTEKCFDEGTIQAFLDGELAPDRLEAVARHTAICDACEYLLREAEDEASFAFTALDADFNSLVPTERIRTNLYQEIAKIENSRPSLWQRIFGSSFSFTNPSLAAFASLMLVFGLFVTLFVYRNANQTSGQLAQSAPHHTPAVQSPIIAHTSQGSDRGIAAVDVSGGETQKTRVLPPVVKKTAPESEAVFEKAAYKPTVKPEDRNGRALSADSQPSRNALLPAEQSYVKTIASLTETVNNRKNTVLRPSEQVDFEKNLAVVNRAIDTMRREVKKNPNNEAAKQILRSSYQNKIDLLNSVAEKQELMAIR